MPAFPDFIDPARATLDAFSGEMLSYEAAGELVTSGSVLGEVVAASEVAAAAAVLAEPLLIVGAGLAAAAAAEAILNKIAPSSPKPQYRNSMATGGRIGGNLFIEYKHKIAGQAEAFDNFSGVGQYQGTASRTSSDGITTWGLIISGAFLGAFSAATSLIEEPLIVTSFTSTGGQPGTEKKPSVEWVNPGTGNVPVPVPVNITIPGGDTTTITPTVYPSRKLQPDQQPNQPTIPGVLVVVPEVGIAIAFNPTSVNIVYLNPSDSPTVFAPPQSTYPKISYPEAECPCPEAKQDELLCRVKALESGLLDDGYEYDPNFQGTADSATVTGLTGEVAYVKLQVSVPTLNSKSQYGNAHAPRVIYSGWLSWIVDGYQTPRESIDYDNQVFIAPEHATGYSFTVTYGGTASHTVYTRRKKPYVDHC